MTHKFTDRSKSDSKERELGIYTWTPNKCMDLGIFLELGNIGAGHAARSLSEVIQQPVAIDVPRIHTLPAHLVPKFYAKHDSPTTAIYMQLRAEAECDILLLFEADEAKKIAAMMTMSPSPEEVDPALEASAIEELANILIGAFLSAMSDFTGVKLIPTPPQRIFDSFDAIIDNFLVKQSLVSYEAIIFDTNFKRASGEASCSLMLFPSSELQNILVEKAKHWIEDGPAKVDESKIICPSDTTINISAAASTDDKNKQE